MTHGGGVGHGRFVMGVVVGRVCGIGRRRRIESRRHKTENQVQDDGTKDGDTIDVAIEDLAREKEECPVEHDVKEGPVQIAVVHQMLIDPSKRVEHCQSL